MLKPIQISREDVFHHIKLSCQLPTMVESIATRRIIEGKAEDLGIIVTPEELQQAADQYRLIHKIERADDTWKWLQKNYLSLDDFEELVYVNRLTEKLAQSLFAHQIEAHFVEHQLDYAGAAIYEVVLPEEDLAWELFYALQEGEVCFHAIARQYIQDPELRRAGGYRGILYRKDLRPELSAAIFAAVPPETLKPILTSAGAHLIVVEDVIQPQLDSSLREQLLADLFSNWLKQQRQQVEVTTQFEFEAAQSTTISPEAVLVTS